MSAEQSEPMILAIAVYDDFLHVYDNEGDLLADDTLCARAGEKFGALEFFDSEGYRLAGKYDGQWRLLRLTRTADSSNSPLVLQRVQSAVDHLRWYIKSHPDEFESDDMTVDDALKLCPDLGGSSDLVTSLRTLAKQFGPVRPRGDYWGSFCHATGWC
jgi:hypothetical protein